MPREMRFPVRPDEPASPRPVISGYCHVIDGDTIVIDGRHIRIAGIDAPELDHPWGRKSKWAMVALCKGQRITARFKPELSYDRLVAECFLPDGRDLAAELVKQGLALDWPKFSGGKYRSLETPDARRKLWRASIRQSGVMWPADEAGPPVVSSPPVQAKAYPRQRRWPESPATRPPLPTRRDGRWLGWFAVPALLLLVVSCSMITGRQDGAYSPATPPQRAQVSRPMATLEVAASALNVRARPSSASGIIGQLSGGTPIIVQAVSGSWIGIALDDGRTGWVYRDYLRSIEE